MSSFSSCAQIVQQRLRPSIEAGLALLCRSSIELSRCSVPHTLRKPHCGFHASLTIPNFRKVFCLEQLRFFADDSVRLVSLRGDNPSSRIEAIRAGPA